MVQLVQVETRAFVDVAVRARELGCPIPVGIALLPGNFATAASAAELRYHKAAPEVRSAWRSLGLTDAGPDLMLIKAPAWVVTASAGHDRNSLGIPDRVPSGIQGVREVPDLQSDANNESANVPLVAFFGRELRSESARLVTYALGAVASVLSAHPGHAGASEIRFDAIVERPGRGSYACIEYRGDACELVALAGKVREVLMGNPSPGMDDDEGA
jgi:hypothetical protein